MKNVTIAISLRVLIIITFSLYAFGIIYYDSPTSLKAQDFISWFPFGLY